MVTSPRSVIGMAAIWVVAIAAVSATAWVAIDRAGRDITDANVNSLAAPTLSTPTPLAPTVTAPPIATDGPAPSVAAPPSAAPTPSTTPGSQPPRNRTAAPGTPQVRTVSVTGGHITVRCIGSRIQLQVAQPENEWRVHVEDNESERVSVSFSKGDHEEADRTEVKAECSRGVPDFDVKTE
jgi:hypothetical protein